MQSQIWTVQAIGLLKSLISIGIFSHEFMKQPGLTKPWAFENQILHALSKGLVEFGMYMPWSFKPNELIPVQGCTGFPLIIRLWVCFRLWVLFCASAISHVQDGACELKRTIPNKQKISYISFREWIEPNMSLRTWKMVLELDCKTQGKSDQQRD